METGRDGARSYEFRSEDIEYLRHRDKPLLARLYRPVGAAGPRPAVVDVHGGAWTSGDRQQNAVIAERLAATGTIVLSLDFRMPPEASFPASICDVNYGIRWLKAKAKSLGLALGRIGGLGTSSGGQQLMLTALQPQDGRYASLPLDEAPTVDASLAFVILGWPVIDPLSRYEMAKQRGNERMVQAHNAFFGSTAAMVEGNPQLIVERGEAAVLPPTLILQGLNDDNLPPDMIDRFVTAYRQAGGTIELQKFPGEPHTFVTKTPDSAASQCALALITGFVAQQAGAG